MDNLKRLPLWIAAYALGLALAAAFAAEWAPVVLALGLPGALALSRLVEQPNFGAWILATVPSALALWRFAAGEPSAATAFLTAVGLTGLAAFGRAAKDRAAVAWPLAALGAFACLVAYFSSGHGAGGPMSQWFLKYGLTAGQAEAITYAFRKTVHLTFYGTVGWTALQAARAAGAEPREAVRTGLLFVLALASFDELRQSGYASRTGSAWDVLLDVVGAIIFVGLSETRRRRMR